MRWMWAGVISAGVVGAAQADVPRVAVDIAPLHSIVASVMGSLGTPDLVVPPGASPHGYSMRPSEARALDRADVIVWVGPTLTPWLEGPVETLGAGAASISVLNVQGTFLLDIREGENFAAHDHDHGHEDEHGDGHDDEHEEGHADEHGDGHDDEHGDAHVDHGDEIDPHAWLDPQNAAVWAGEIATNLSELDPENASTYAQNAQMFQQQMTALETELNASLSQVRGRPFVVFHDAYHYFEHRFEIEAVGSVSDSDATAPSAARVSALQATITDLGAVCALAEPQYNPGLLTAIGAATLGVIDPLGAEQKPGPELYPNVLRAIAGSLVDCLG